ncbi:MAG: tRNA (adenosine(37)-N6)-dimethylallyltransferase MiaA, partial [Candidatus Marinimicrobia bacterium]|nr:tRNA (adenosine(37)-N6)-dimethylallyltransferase MiaA [Candidatus Neomarinimicrobiota bacterium]
MKPKILVIIGPTAVGKTAIAIELAKQINSEIIGLDSRQIYFGMEIGTAQPTTTEMQGIRHHLFGIRSPDKVVTAGEYAKLVNAIIVDIRQRNHVPIICGGAGLYYRALREGIFNDSISDSKIRKELEKEYENNPQYLFKHLNDIDPEYANIVHINNKKRLVRALEIYKLTGKTPSEHFAQQKKENQSKLKLFTVLLTMDRKLLFERICKRTEQMLQNGLIKEVETLLTKYDINDVHPLDSIGYRQIILHLKGNLNHQEMIDEIN